MIACSRLPMARSGSRIAAIFASTALSPFALAAFSSWTRSFIATRSSSVKPLNVLPVAAVRLADFCVPLFGRIDLRLCRRLLRIVRRIDIGHRKWTHPAHANEGGNLHRCEVVGVCRYGSRIANLHRFGLRCIEGVAHADEERPLLDCDHLSGGMEVGRD